MVVLLLVVALVALTILALLLAGVVVSIVTGLTLINVLAMVIGLRRRRDDDEEEAEERPPAERWRPSAFRAPPEPPYESDEHPPLTIYRR